MRIALIQQHASYSKRQVLHRGLDALRLAADDGAQVLAMQWVARQRSACWLRRVGVPEPVVPEREATPRDTGRPYAGLKARTAQFALHG